MSLEAVSKLVESWRKATKAISADGAERPLEWEGKDILRLCADELAAALAAEGQARESAATQIADDILLRIAKRYANCEVNIYPHCPELTPVEAVLRCAKEEGFHLTNAAAPSLHKEGESGKPEVR